MRCLIVYVTIVCSVLPVCKSNAMPIPLRLGRCAVMMHLCD